MALQITFVSFWCQWVHETICFLVSTFHVKQYASIPIYVTVNQPPFHSQQAANILLGQSTMMSHIDICYYLSTDLDLRNLYPTLVCLITV